MELTNDDAAFILGKGGRTKEKIARVAKATIDLPARSLTLQISGPHEACRKAKKYVRCVMAQRIGAVTIEDYELDEDDCTVLVRLLLLVLCFFLPLNMPHAT